MSDTPDIFDANRRRLRRDRAQPGFATHDFLIERIGEGLLDRLDTVTRRFTAALDLGCWDGRLGRALAARGVPVQSIDAGARFAAAAGGVQADEDRPIAPPGTFDLIVSAGVLDQVGDLPGALALARAMLRPDGLFLAAFAGAGSLPVLRQALLAGDMAAGGGVPARIHPQIDVRSAGDLLLRAGFALPVADVETVDVSYADPIRLMHDLRGMAWTNMLSGERPPLTRARLAAIFERFAAEAGPDGRVTERFEIVTVTAWAPSADQPRPARPGSGKTSLASALRARH